MHMIFLVIGGTAPDENDENWKVRRLKGGI